MSADWLNYHHLLYFWVIAKEGSISRACGKLHLSQPTLSAQLIALEKKLGGKLFDRVGRGVVLTELGNIVFRYADEIFSIGEELVDTLRGIPGGRPMKLVVGVPDVLPKLIAFRLLEPVLSMDEKIRIVCREGPLEQLLAGLAMHQIDVVFSDIPASSMVRVQAYNHPLGECGVGLFCVNEIRNKYRRGLPGSLQGAPIMLPAPNTQMRRSVEKWLSDEDIKAEILGEIDDTALLKVFAEAGVCIIPGPLAIQSEIEKQFGLKLLLEIPGSVERFYAITVERRIRHPAIAAICESAQQILFR